MTMLKDFFTEAIIPIIIVTVIVMSITLGVVYLIIPLLTFDTNDYQYQIFIGSVTIFSSSLYCNELKENGDILYFSDCARNDKFTVYNSGVTIRQFAGKK